MSKTDLDTSNVQKGYYDFTYITQFGSSSGSRTTNCHTTNIKRVSRVTSRFEYVARRHELRPNQFSYSKYEKWGASGTAYFKSNSNSQVVDYYRGQLSGVCYDDSQSKVSLSTLEAAAIDSQAKIKLRNNAKDQHVNLAQATAERHQTVDLFTKTATRIGSALGHLKRGNIVSAAESVGIKASKRMSKRFGRNFRKSQSDAIANGWLELQYGWKPLLQDVYGSALAIANQRYAQPLERVSSSVTTERVSETVVKSDNELPKRLQTRLTYTRKYVCYFRLNNDVTHAATALGLTNPAMVAWELLPYSFVVDWFLPIGDWINSMDATQGLTFSHGSVTTFEKAFVLQTWSGSVKRTNDVKLGDAMAAHEWVTVTRDVLSTWPSIGFPVFKNPSSIGHALNAMALLQQHRK